ncbi:hypothetical protein [Amaricoccus solimangrovi]|uniref:Uncharacterized protein n=1 Tax=Amaricoccus solimangrovi TaxID=2589815 RepID=A0A501WK50_9RHOB|nr:hypothetical protein [Amaricoccus solimangrovi]TPE50233.1 hypothetical protein FJM51_12680 [Amaricoccus solimangrovi]
MTPAEVVAALHGPRLPEGTASLGPGALVAAFGLGLLIALALFALARPVLRARRRAPRPADLLARLAALPDTARPLAAARLFGHLGAPPPEAVAARLYRPTPAPLDPRTLEPALAAAFAQAAPEARRTAHV